MTRSDIQILIWNNWLIPMIMMVGLRSTHLSRNQESERKVVVSPFSEIVRFYKDDKFKALFEGISLIEFADTNTRIYIPLIGLKHRFETF